MTKLRGRELLDRPSLNKGTAFTASERKRFGLDGLLPPHIETLDSQAARAYGAYLEYQNDLGRHVNLRALQDINEVLFYRVLLDHLEEMMPIVYTPGVALGCQYFSRIYRRPRGLFISYPLQDRIEEILRNRAHPDVDVIVVTDGERVLGIGDQGVGGLAISIGKLSLYSLIGGIPPSRTLPVVLDVGTNDTELLKDPAYLGWRHERISGQQYDDFVDQFVQAVQRELPDTCLQWEDFSQQHARRILDRYSNQLLTFNDDIQGTAAVALAAILAGVQVTGQALKDQRIVFLGAGSAAIGVADYLRDAMVSEGLSWQEAVERFWIVDKFGLLDGNRTDLTPEQAVYARPAVGAVPQGLADVMRSVEATILIGLSTAAGAFTEELVTEMARKTGRPIIFPLSNPTARSEATPADLLRWTKRRALVATGSPFPPVEYEDASIAIAQCNNVYIFPAIGLALAISKARRVTDSMMQAAAKALAANAPALRDPSGPLLPPLREARRIAVEIAVAVAMEAQASGLASPRSADELRSLAAASQWTPVYPSYEME